MVTVQFSRQEMVNMVRRARLREAASEATRDLPGPVVLDQAEAWEHGITRNDLISRMAAAHDALCTATGPAGRMPPPSLPCAVSARPVREYRESRGDRAGNAIFSFSRLACPAHYSTCVESYRAGEECW